MAAPNRAGVVLLAAVAVVLQPEPAAAARLDAVRKLVAARQRAAAGLPDPSCHTGVISLKTADKPQVCCAGYCGECSDYPTCESVRGQNSTEACCKSKVYAKRCGSAPANVCLKKCSESVPPCIMDEQERFTTPDPKTRTAGEDCHGAVKDWRAAVHAATKTTTPAP
mmetsp:Transcript_16577/g.52174  ORF Transcript_16577/g.52174 Transcript_16577/m.52174 type:complete len:167 (+) Transcript_16577:92-592(+)